MRVRGRASEQRRTSWPAALGALAAAVGALTLVLGLGIAFLVKGIGEIELPADFDLCQWPSPIVLRGMDAEMRAERWRRREEAAALPVVEGDVVLLVRPRGIRALDVATGRRRWSVDVSVLTSCELVPAMAERPGSGVISAFGGQVVVLGRHGRISAYDMKGGARLWEARLPGATSVAAAEQVVVADDGGRLHGLDRSSGAPRWSTQISYPGLSGAPYAPLVAAGSTVGVTLLDETPATSGAVARPTGAAGPTTSTVFVDATTGAERWRSASGALSSFAYGPDVAMLFEYGEPPRLVAREGLSGAERWTAEAPFGTLTVGRAGVTLASASALRTYDPSTGKQLATTPHTIDARVLGVSGGVVVLSS